MQIELNGKSYQLNALSPTIKGLVEELGYVGKRIAIECNGNIIPKSQYEKTLLNENDRLEIIVAVGGG